MNRTQHMGFRVLQPGGASLVERESMGFAAFLCVADVRPLLVVGAANVERLAGFAAEHQVGCCFITAEERA